MVTAVSTNSSMTNKKAAPFMRCFSQRLLFGWYSIVRTLSIRQWIVVRTLQDFNRPDENDVDLLGSLEKAAHFAHS